MAAHPFKSATLAAQWAMGFMLVPPALCLSRLAPPCAPAGRWADEVGSEGRPLLLPPLPQQTYPFTKTPLRHAARATSPRGRGEGQDKEIAPVRVLYR